MSAQPANTSIKVYRQVRAFRRTDRHETIAALIKRLRPLIMSVPGKEILVGALARDTSTKDFSPYMGEARHNANRGFPVVVGLFDQVSFAKAQATLPDVDFAFQVGHDKFIQNTQSGLSRDLHKDLRAVAPDVDVA